MDVTKLLRELHSERERIDQAILSLEQLSVPAGKRRGRPPKGMSAAKAREINPHPTAGQASTPVN